jgi:hypothetical protein
VAARGVPVLIPALANSGTAVSTYRVYGWVPNSDGSQTATPRTFYTDAALTTPASNPATLGASTRVVYINPSLSIVLEIKSADGVTSYGAPYFPSEVDIGTDQPITVPTYAALTALTAITGLTDRGIYYTVSRTNILDMNDGSSGFWEFKLGATTTANGGTILADDANTGRFYRKHGGRVNIGVFGAVGDGVTSITAALNLWNTALQNSSNDAPCPRAIYVGVGSWVALTKPNKFEDVGYISIECSGLQTVFRMGFTCANETEALFHAYGATVLNISSCAIGTLAGGSKGGSLIRLEAKASSAPDFSHLDDIYFTSYGVASTQVVATATTANPAVFGITAHGYSNGDEVVYTGGTGGTWPTVSHQLCTISDVTANSFTLTVVATGVKIDGSGLGTYSASTATVKKGLCSDYPVSIDGSARTTNAIGVRGPVISNCQIFGGRKGAVLANGVIGLPMPGTITSDAGWNAAIKATGTASVPNYYIKIDGATVSRIELDRSFYAIVTSQVQADVIQTANTFGTQIIGPVGAKVTRLGSKNSGPDVIMLPGGMCWQKKAVTGASGAALVVALPHPLSVAPAAADFISSDPVNTVFSSPTVNGVSVVNSVNSAFTIQVHGEFAA